MRNANRFVWVLSTALLFNVPAKWSRDSNALDNVTHSATYEFVERDGACLFGKILRADATSITVQPLDKSPITVPKESLLQISQGNGLLYSARSSWADVSAVNLYPHEALVLTFKTGTQVKGQPTKTSSDGITLKHGFGSTLYPKSEISTVDYLRVKPASDFFMGVLGEAPWMLIFDPEFYYRAAGLPGRIKIRLYDATKPQDNTPVGCKNRK